MASTTTEEENDSIIKKKTVKEEKDVTSSNKRRKVDDDYSPLAELVNSPVNAGTASTANSTAATALSSDVGKENLRSADLKNKDSEETEVSAINISQFSGESSRSNELCGEESEEFTKLSSATKKKSSVIDSHVKTSVAAAPELPSAAEIEDFLAMAEKQEHKRFAEKYNFDVMNDVPLEGRYEWTRVYDLD